eukprot:scaffold2584_cov53-Attheya_sp.AAC.6
MKKSITKLPAIMERTKAMTVVLLLVLATSIPQAMGTEGNIRGLTKNTPKNAIQMWAAKVNAGEGTKAKKIHEKIHEKTDEMTDEMTVEKTDSKIVAKRDRTRVDVRVRERVRTDREQVVAPNNQGPPPQLEQKSIIGVVEDPCALGSVSQRHCNHYRIMELNQNYNPKSLDKPVCRSTSSASFGSFSRKSAMIEFVYEMEVDIKNADNVVFGQVVPMIERALTDSLLPVFFNDDCSEYNPQVSISRRRLLEGSSGVIGISGIPYDTEKKEKQCVGALTSPENKCYVMDGWITLYSNEPVEVATIALARQSLQDNMIAGKFNKKINKFVIQKVVGLKYSTLNPDALENDDNNLSPRRSPSGPPIFVYVLLSVGLVIILAVFALYRRIRHQDEEDDSQNYSDGGVISEKFRDDKTARSDLTPPEDGTVSNQTTAQQPLTVYTPAYRDDVDDETTRSSDNVATRPSSPILRTKPRKPTGIYEPL